MSAAEAYPEQTIELVVEQGHSTHLYEAQQNNTELVDAVTFAGKLDYQTRHVLIGMLAGRNLRETGEDLELKRSTMQRSCNKIYDQLSAPNRYAAVTALLGARKSVNWFRNEDIESLTADEARLFELLANDPNVSVSVVHEETPRATIDYRSKSIYKKLGVEGRSEFWSALHGAFEVVEQILAAERLGLFGTLSEQPSSPLHPEPPKRKPKPAVLLPEDFSAPSLYKGLRSFVHASLDDTRRQMGEDEMLDPSMNFESNLDAEEIEHLIELDILPESTRRTERVGIVGYVAGLVLASEDFRYALYNPFTQKMAAEIISYITHDAKLN
jgi:hypothetical protein